MTKNNPTPLEEADDLPVMDEREWPIYAVLLKTGELYWHDTSWGNRYNTGDGWLMVLPWGEARERGGFHRGDNRFGIEHEDVAAFTLLNGLRANQAAFEAMREALEESACECASERDLRICSRCAALALAATAAAVAGN